MKKKQLQEELTTAMHYEFMSDEFTELDMKIMGVRGRINRGIPLKEALAFYGLTEKEYTDNLEQVMKK